METMEKPEINTVMSWLEGLADDDWADLHSDSEIQNIAKAALEIIEDQCNQIHHMGLIITEHEREIERVKRLAGEMAKIAVHRG